MKRHTVRFVLLFGTLIASLTAQSAAQDAVVLPSTATALEGRPTVVVTSGEEGTEKKALSAEEARKGRLLITIVNGEFFWASRENRPLELTTSGAFSYLSSPGAYIKFTRIGRKIVYMEHVSLWLTTLTYWGELEVVDPR